jgi:hypothetical protein
MNRRFLGAPTVAGALVFGVILCCAVGLHAQAVAVAEIDGVVTDASGKVVPGAQITATETDKHLIRETTSNGEGRYSLPDLPIGPYLLEVKSPGFKDFKQTGITLRTAQSTEIDVQLTIGAVTESVEVVANASMVETKDSAIGQVMDQRKVEELPLNGRNSVSFITLVGGATTATPPGGDLTGSKNIQGSQGSITFSVGGSQANGISFLLDGGDNNDSFTNVNLPIPPPDFLAEFNVQTSSLQAQYGLHPGAVVNIQTKSGSNAFHGDIFDYFRNYELNARPKGIVETNSAGAITSNLQQLKDSLKRNQYGGVIGGRILRDKLFFFAGYQQTTQRSNPSNNTAHVPTALTIAGNFQVEDAATSAGGCQSKAITLTDPVTKLGFPNQTIPAARQDPASMTLLTKYIPQSTDNCGVYLFAYPLDNPDWQIDSRIDFNKNDKNQMFARWYVYNFTALTIFDGKDALTTGTPGNKDETNTVTFGDTYTLSPTEVNSLHLTWNRRADNRGTPANFFGPTSLGIQNFAELMPNNYIQLGATNYFNIGSGTGAPGYFDINNYQVSDDFSWTKGKHQIGIGWDFRKEQFNETNNQQSNGQWQFGTAITGDGLGDTEIGALSSLTDGNALSDYMRQTIFAAYIQDTWRVTPHLSLNIGARWEPEQPTVDKQCRGNQFTFANFVNNVHSTEYPGAPAGLLFGNDAGNPNGCQFQNSHWLDTSPRFGFVYDPIGNGKQTIRGGFALMHDATELFYPERWTTNAPYTSSVALGQGKGDGFPGSAGVAGPFSNPWLGVPGGDPFPGNSIFPLNGTYVTVPPNMPAMYMMQWNLAIQRQFGQNWLASLTYQGNHTVHIIGQNDINPPTFEPGMCAAGQFGLTAAGPCSTTSNEIQRRAAYLINPAQGAYYTGVDQSDPGGTAFYNAMMAKLEKRLSNHYTILANYTFSHCLSNVDFAGELSGNNYQNPNYRGGEGSNCASDRRQIFNLSFVATSAGYTNNMYIKQLTKDWQVSPLITLQTGQPFTITDGTDVSLTGEGDDRPNVVPGVSNKVGHAAGLAADSAMLWFNPAAFAGTCGANNYAYNAGTGPAVYPTLGALSANGPSCEPLGTFGDLTRLALYGPGSIQWDMSISRVISIRERYKLDVRAEFYNFMNHANLGGPSTAISSTTFGQITSFGGPRLIELNLKLHF